MYVRKHAGGGRFSVKHVRGVHRTDLATWMVAAEFSGPHRGLVGKNVGAARDNTGMSALASALAYKRLLDDNATLRMLRADHVAVSAALLSAHLGSPGIRLTSEDLYEVIDADLEELRPHFELPKTAKAYCDDWRNASFLIRRPATEARGETYELSSDALSAIRVLDQLETPRSTLTESRLVSLAAGLRQLAVDTDPDATRRLEALHQERERIDAEIARIRDGEFAVLDERRALERVTDILLQAQDLPADFARVRARFEQLNHELRVSIVNTDDTQSTVLDDVFRGVDLIESSNEGRTFTAFSALIRDPERSAAFDTDVAAVLDRDFADRLAPEARRALRTLVRELKAGSREVHGVLTEFARGLRRYVHSQEFQRDRALRGVLQEALAAAVAASKRIRPYADTGIEVELSAMRLFSVGEMIADDPSEFDTGARLADDEPGIIDFEKLAAIARESEIDFAELIRNVNELVAGSAPMTVSEILAFRPATQGLASIIGLLSLATRHGQVRRGETERLTWQGADGIRRHADVDTHIFTERIEG